MVMEDPGMKNPVIGSSNELHLLMDSIRGIQRLNRYWTESGGIDSDVPHSISAMLILLNERMRLLDRAVQGIVDPLLVWCPENDGTNGNDEDVILVAWSERKLIRHHRAEWRKAKTLLRWKNENKGKASK